MKEAKKSPINATIKTEFEEEDPLEIKTENISDDEEMLENYEGNLIEYQNEFIKSKDLHYCQICEAGFPKKWKLKAHMKYEHQDYEEKTLYDCSHCKYSATTKNNVLKHINEVHEGEKSPENVAKCPICLVEFSRKTNWVFKLKRHIESIHRGKGPHKCQLCEFIDIEFPNIEGNVSLLGVNHIWVITFIFPYIRGHI